MTRPVKYLRFIPILLVAAVCGCGGHGCTKPVSSAIVPAVNPGLPTAAQPKLQTLKLWLGAEELVAELALTGVQQQTGMMFRTTMAENAGMLFPFTAPPRVGFWLMNCPLP